MIRIAGIVQESIVDGPGFRLAVFTQGCPHHCPGCHNPETHSFTGGTLVDTETIITMMNNPLLDGITLTGGDPFCQPESCTMLAKAAHDRGLNVWAYSGWTLDEILSLIDSARQLLGEVDVLVDGPYLESQRTLDALFRGSRNQRLIDVKRTLSEKQIIEWRVDK